MRRPLVVALASIAGLWVTVKTVRDIDARSLDTATAGAEQEIQAVELERNQAILNGDAAALDRLTSDDYTFINQRGELRTKAQILAGFRSGSFKYDARDVSDLRVRVFGDAAVVTGRAVQKGTEDTKDYSGENRFTRVYVKQRGRWVSVALQVTLVAKP